MFYHRTETNSGISQQINCSSGLDNVTKLEIHGLHLLTNYTFAVAGYTRKGIGSLTEKFVVRTGPYGELR